MELYHTSSVDLKDGTLLEHRYGGVIQDERYFQHSERNYLQYLKEMLFEDIRKEFYPSVPSRLNCLYILNGIDSAKEYAKSQNKTYIAEVTIISSGGLLTADMNWLNIADKRQSYDGLKEIAHQYFKGESSNNPSWETLFNGEAHSYNCLKI